MPAVIRGNILKRARFAHPAVFIWLYLLMVETFSIGATVPETWEDWCCPMCDCAGPSPGPALFTISRRSSSLDQPLKTVVRFSGTATFAADYILFGEIERFADTSIFITIPAGKSSVDVGIYALWDTATEVDETVVANLGMPAEADSYSRAPAARLD